MQASIHFFIISRSFLLIMRNVSDKSCRGNQNTHFKFNNFFFLNRAVYVMMWKNMVQPGRTYMTIWRMRIACCIPKAKNTYSEYVILTAFLLQQWLQSRSSVLRYMYITVNIFGWKVLSVRAAAHSRMYAIKFFFFVKTPFFSRRG
jgi:hypothetical protein